MDRERALRTLGLDKGAQADDISRAYRALIRQAHPDVGGSTAVAARITEAYHWLQRAGSEPSKSSKPSPPAQNAQPASTGGGAYDGSFVLQLPPGDVFARLIEAGHHLGEVSYVDHDAGIMQITFTAENGVVCQLAATVTTGVSRARKPETRVEFTLDPLASGEAPPIDKVVARLARIINGIQS